MKIVLVVAGVIAVVIAAVVVMGARLPQRHFATRTAVFKANQERLFALVAGAQNWRPDVQSSELIEQDGKTFERETSKHGETILYALEGSRPPFAIQRRIATKNLPYGGTWYIALERVNEGDPDSGTMVRITEDGEVYNPFFRFVSKYIIGETATQDAYLKAMGKAAGENVQPGD